MDKLLRFSHTANYDVMGVGRALSFSIPVWVLGDKQGLLIKSVKWCGAPSAGLSFIKIEAIISPLPDIPAKDKEPEAEKELK